MANNDKLVAKDFLSREQILAHGKSSLEARSVQVAEWGNGWVRYRPMTMALRRKIRKSCFSVEVDPTTGESTNTLDPEKFEVMALIYCCLDPEDPNKLLFDTRNQRDLEEKMASGPISTISTAILRDSGLAPDAVKRGQSGITEG